MMKNEEMQKFAREFKDSGGQSATKRQVAEFMNAYLSVAPVEDAETPSPIRVNVNTDCNIVLDPEIVGWYTPAEARAISRELCSAAERAETRRKKGGA